MISKNLCKRLNIKIDIHDTESFLNFMLEKLLDFRLPVLDLTPSLYINIFIYSVIFIYTCAFVS